MRSWLPSHLAINPAARDVLAMAEIDARWRNLLHVETGLATNTETGSALASAIARAAWKDTPMDGAREPLRRYELARDGWKSSPDYRPDEASLAADLFRVEELAKSVKGYAVPTGSGRIDEAVQGPARSALADATFSRLENRWRWLMEWINGEDEPKTPSGRAAWRLKALERGKSSLLKRWLDFESRWLSGQAPDEEVFEGGYQIDLGTAEKRAEEKGYATAKNLEPADRIVPHPAEMPKAKAAEAVLEKVEEAKKFASEASGGVADELVPTWMRPYLIGLAFFGGVGAALTRLEGVEKMSGLFRALKR